MLHKCTLLISGSYWVWNEFQQFTFLPFAQMLLLFIYSLILLGLMNDGKGWSLRQNIKVAPLSSLEGFSFTFPSAEVYVSQWTRRDLYTFVLLHPLFFFKLQMRKWFSSLQHIGIEALVWRCWGLPAQSLAHIAVTSGRQNRHQQNDDCLCHLNMIIITEETY